ncbi:S1/P1 nuclease [Rhodocyclus tenuis]|uniref:S1/P1 Nuclease n=1 Tax=Rhodocyclus tenuis TaxID=1066 RepID=A0A840GD42_RHOTE|nr:S1/P1 nuclease [Rhodocyclus tenuis]MBB4246159.1 hypothetical protein [Rhodocyclus tenuis]
MPSCQPNLAAPRRSAATPSAGDTAPPRLRIAAPCCHQRPGKIARALPSWPTLAAFLQRRLGAALLICGILIAPAAQAWNAAGHRLCAYIAWQSLDLMTRQHVAVLLRLHPDHSRWLARARDADPDLAAFVEASTWADELRRDPRFHAEEEAPTALLPGFPDTLRHRDWHYVDRPLSGSRSGAATDGELPRQLERMIHIVGDRNADARRRAWALPWLIHLVADAHQPLHVGSRFDERGRSDDGGNALLVDNPFVARRHIGSLHRYWDELPGPPWLRGSTLVLAAQGIVAEHPPPAPAGRLKQWLDESLAVARDEAYPADKVEPPTITARFNERARRTAAQRVAWSGYRLAGLLQQGLRSHPDASRDDR